MEPKNRTKRPKAPKTGSSRPRVQSQPVYRPQMYESSFQAQLGFRPQMYESTPFSYTTQQPGFAENFNLFEIRTPVHVTENDSESEEEFVPETQPINEEAEEVQEVQEAEVRTRPKKADKKSWTQDEEEALAKSWIKISVDKHVGDRQTKAGFWRRVLKHFESLMPGTTRTKDQVNSKWCAMNPAIVAFNGYYHQAVRLNQSGCSDLQVFERAATDYQKQYKKPFNHVKAWHIVKDQPKWQEQELVAQESEGSSKKRKSSDSSNVQTPINEHDFDCDLPNLNENPAPTRQSKGKKKATVESSDRDSMREAVARYTAKKETLLDVQLEAQRKKDDEYYKFIEAEAYNRYMKFVMEPHDNIPDPTFKEFVIGRKRELCAKYGWPCSL